jgi:maleylacetate reductase
MRVRFGPGAIAHVPEEVERAGLHRVLVVSGPHHADLADELASSLGERSAGVLTDARMHTPVDVARDASARATDARADGCVAVGGGSAVGLAKAVARDLGVAVVAVPTTYAGSEMTPVWGLTDGGRKTTGRDPRVLPVSVVYDPVLTLGMPAGLTVTSAMNAVAHAVEGLYAPDASPVVSLMAQEGVRAFAGALPAVAADGSDLDARSEALYGAWLCGAVLGATTMGLHHQLCHALGGALGLPHSETHTVLLPHVLAYNAPAAPVMVSALQQALGASDPAAALWELEGRLGAPRALRDLGMAEADIAVFATQVAAAGLVNPRGVTADDLARLLRRAWAGESPQLAPAMR